LPELNDLLEGSFAAHRDTSEVQLPDWLRRSETFLKKPPSIDMDFDLDEESVQSIRNSGSGKKIKKEILEGDGTCTMGQEALAFYKPYVKSVAADFIPWGIHFRMGAILDYAVELLPGYKELLPDLTFGRLTQFLVEVILTHEVEHATQELLGALEQSINPQKSPIYLRNFGSHSFQEFTETSATQQEMTKGALKSKLKNTQTRPLILRWSTEPLPPFYRDWNKVSIDSADHGVCQSIAPTVSIRELNNLRDQVGDKGSNRLVKIPKYYWMDGLTTGNVPTVFLRTVIDCKKMSRFLKKADGKSPLGVPISVKPSPDHDFQIVSPLTARPIKFACHAWREVPEMVIGQLSDAFGASSKAEFKRYLCSSI